ncbi:hypothetical protein BC826DRAFT_1101748 [Russula brevipes]|nr:hypothetical protein BC826DRAFT_1101748 [Russula brevipes]
MEKPLWGKSSQRNNAASPQTINVVLPDKSHSSRPVTFGKSDEPEAPDGSRNRSSTKANDIHPNAEISAVPDPVPYPVVQAQSSPAGHTTPPVDPPRTITASVSSSVSTYSSTPVVLGPLLPSHFAASSLPSVSSSSFALPTSASAEWPVGTFNGVPSQQTTSHQLPAASIILLAVGSVLLVTAILILTKLCIRPRRRSHPTPSLPILQDAFPPRKMGDESPLFGGKERLSSQPGNDAIPWTWTQYQSDMPKPMPAASISKSDAMNQSPMRYSRLVDEPPNLIHMGEPTMQEALTKPGTTNQSSDGHPNKALSRLSSLSGLVYTASVYDSSGQENIGIALSSGHGDLESGVSVSAARDYRKRASARQSLRNFDKRRSTIYGSPEGLAYAMSPSSSPAVDDRDDADGSSRQGRARVKAPYVAGSYLRCSTRKGSDERDPDVNPFRDPVNTVYALPPKPGSAAGKEVSSKGGVLGVGSITPDLTVSPGFSLYPDDSLSVADDRNWVVTQLGNGKGNTQEGAGRGEVEDDVVVAADGRLSGAASPGVAGRLNRASTRAQDPVKKLKRMDDGPPRVPSPPVLPSLAQMAMAHANGQDYGDYRSPTYSLYGFYSGSSERRSRGEV